MVGYILLFCLSCCLGKAAACLWGWLLRATSLHCCDSWKRAASEKQDATWTGTRLLAVCLSVLCNRASLKSRKAQKEFRSLWLGTETVSLKPERSSLCLRDLYSAAVRTMVVLSSYLLKSLRAEKGNNKTKHCFWFPKEKLLNRSKLNYFVYW